jgi:hypothetical protein
MTHVIICIVFEGVKFFVSRVVLSFSKCCGFRRLSRAGTGGNILKGPGRRFSCVMYNLKLFTPAKGNNRSVKIGQLIKGDGIPGVVDSFYCMAPLVATGCIL